MDEIVCLRKVDIPLQNREAFFAWIEDSRPLRRRMGCSMERVLEPADGQGDTLYITIWKSHAVFDAWIKTPEHDALSKSAGHRLVKWHPLKRYNVPGGW